MSANRREILDLIEEPIFPERQYLDEEADAARVADVVKRALRPWTTRSRTDCSVAVSVQGEGAVGALVELPPLKKKQIDVALEIASMRLLSYPSAEASVGVVPVSITSSGSSWFLAAVRKQALELLNDCVQDCGQTIGKAEINLLPLTRAFGANHPVEGSAVEGLISVGSRLTTVIAVRGRRPVALRCFLIGGADFTYSYQMSLQASWADAEKAKLESDASAREVAVEPTFQRWLGQVGRSLDAWSQGGGPGRPQRLMLTGGSAAWKGMAARLADHVSLPVASDAWNRLQPPRERENACAGTFGLAVGLCLPDEDQGGRL